MDCTCSGPSEIESCLLCHPSISTCAVIGIPDSSRGELIKAYIVLHPHIMRSFGIHKTTSNITLTLDHMDYDTYRILNTHPTLLSLKPEISEWVKRKLAAHEC